MTHAGIKGMGIGFATSNRGACHLRVYTPAAEIIGNVLGPAELTDRLAWEGKAKLTMIFQRVHAMTDCLDLCKFSTFAESLDGFAAQFSTFTGTPVTAGDLLAVGDPVYNLERYYNNLVGFGEGSDYLPKRFWTLPADGQGSEAVSARCDPMLAEYYAERGWVNGVVPESKLKELEIFLSCRWQVAGGASRKWLSHRRLRSFPVTQSPRRRRCNPLWVPATCDLPPATSTGAPARHRGQQALRLSGPDDFIGTRPSLPIEFRATPIAVDALPEVTQQALPDTTATLAVSLRPQVGKTDAVWKIVRAESADFRTS